MSEEKILVTGACGQVGTELTMKLREIHGNHQVIATDISSPSEELKSGPFEELDVLENDKLEQIVEDEQITQIYHLAALLSAKAEQHIEFAWELNTKGLLHVLNLAREKDLNKIYWPSSIAVFGPNTPVDHTPQVTITNPNTVYGISKLACERWCEYYYRKFDVDVRSLRYPGLIGYKAMPGGGTTDYAVEIYHKALEGQPYTCFLEPDTNLPMMYMEDAVKATIDLMQADADNLTVRDSYNVAAMSFTPREIAASIQKEMPEFSIDYNPDYRQQIADSWPNSIDDSKAREDWNWKPAFDLDKMSQDMLANLREMKHA
jgi:nucleoside-diphosphate-sugar epimerase